MPAGGGEEAQCREGEGCTIRNPMLPDLDSIDLFLRAVKLNSLSKAAAERHLSLSAASRRLALLEHHFGAVLLDRLPSGVVPTAAGEALARHAQALMRDVDVMQADLSDYAHGSVGRVRLYANISAMSQDLPEKLARWSRQNPRIKLDIQEARSRDIVEAVRRGQADIGVVTSAPLPDLQYLPYAKDHLCVIVPPRHALRARSVSFAALLDHDFVGLDDSAQTTQTMKQAAEAAGKFLRLRVQVQSFEALCRLVAAGQGIGVMPKGSVDAFRQVLGLRLIDLDDEWAQRDMYLCLRAGPPSAPIARVVAHLRGVAPKGAGAGAGAQEG
jgi:DNA-binding transcriptional LysR family regulator